MPDTIEQKALALLNEVCAEMGLDKVSSLELDMPGERALLRAIEQHSQETAMTDEAKALVERLRDDLPQTLIEKHWVDDNDAIYKQREEAADLIETQAREIERLRAVLDNIAHESSDTWARRDACVALGIDWPETRRQP